MKKIFLLVISLSVFILSGCAEKPVDISSLDENYSTVISMPYAQLIGTNISDFPKNAGVVTFSEEKQCYILDKTIMEFSPFFVTDDTGVIKITGFETEKKVDKDFVTYIKGLYNMLCSYYGSVEINPDIKQRINSLNDISMCKDGEIFEEMWGYNGFPIEYKINFESGTGYIKIQYNKMPDIK